MAWRIVVQPDGRYARFSEVVDDFTHINMTREQAVDVCRYHCGVKESEQKVKRAESEPERWNEAVATILTIHGERHAKRVTGSATNPNVTKTLKAESRGEKEHG